jgi:hypothetical protein
MREGRRKTLERDDVRLRRWIVWGDEWREHADKDDDPENHHCDA